MNWFTNGRVRDFRALPFSPNTTHRKARGLNFRLVWGRRQPPHKFWTSHARQQYETCTQEEPPSSEVAVITAVRTTSDREFDRQAVVVLVNEVRKAQAAVRNVRHQAI